jgi:preprotein translocase SecE subunit
MMWVRVPPALLGTAGRIFMGNRKYVHLVFMVGAILLSWILIQATSLVWSYFGPPHELYSKIIGLLLGIGIIGSSWIRPKSFDKVGTIVSELNRVTYPSKQETTSATYVVIITVFISAVIMFSFDWFWSYFTDLLLTV